MNHTPKRVGLVTAGLALVGATLAGCGDPSGGTDKAEDKPASQEAGTPAPDELEEFQALRKGGTPRCKLSFFQRGGKKYMTFGHSKAMKSTVTDGTTGGRAREAQCFLNALNCPVGSVDGIFGRKSVRATIRFQEANRLTGDGIIGPKTWLKLRRSPARC